MINVTSSPMTIADYCQAFREKQIIVNRDYQRSWEVWPHIAQSFLVESVILGFPVPKLSLHQVLDLKSRKTTKEIVDGQQRTAAIFEFFQGELRLSDDLETASLAGRTYDEIGEDYQQDFLSYSLAIDLFVGATNEEIREVFRRMNSHTVPLNPEEDRHASYQGEFKWYIYHLARSVEGILGGSGVLTHRSFVRMQDAKLLTEITHALQDGITTTSKKSLTKIYKELDSEFPMKEKYRKRLDGAFGSYWEFEEIHNGPLTKSYVVYSLILALIHVRRPVTKLNGAFELKRGRTIDRGVALGGLLRLAEALEEKEDHSGPLRPFVDACMKQTNVKAQRETRFEWLCRALIGQLPT